jgi:OPT family small oligopeptide transporter
MDTAEQCVINQLFGQITGLSLIPITFDWTQITGYTGSPLIPPWHAIANTLIGTVLFFGIATIGIHYSGAFYAAYLPISDSNSYDNTQGLYNVSNILSPNLTLDVAKYQAYSPLFLPTTFVMAYGMSFAAISAVIVHTTLFNGREIWIRLRAKHEVADDIHTRMMKKYPLVPAWWYGGLFVAIFAMSFGLIYGWPTHLPGWGLLIALVIFTVWLVPIGMIQAITNVQIGLNVFTEFLVGYMLPGKPIAMMLFKTLGYISMLQVRLRTVHWLKGSADRKSQALYFLQDLKLGHYVKVPQRPMFCAQVFATIWSCFVQLAVLEWSLDNICDICTKHQANRFSCPSSRVFFYASVIWGCIGPQRIFSPGAMYASMQWFWLVGVLTPVAIYLAARRFPRTSIRFLNAPVIFSGTGNLPPATPLNYVSYSVTM